MNLNPMSPQAFHLIKTVPDLRSLEKLGERLAACLRPGDVITLDGPLGAGKTTLVQTVGKALGLNERPVSPTFVLIHEYTGGRLPIVHADLYRLEDKAESLADDLLAPVEDGAVLFVEWATFGPFLDPLVTLGITIAITDEGEGREFTFKAPDAARWQALQ